jgi:hypothetical protein
MSGESKLPAGLDWKAFTPEDSPITPPELMADPAVQDLSTAKLAVGDPAFDFDLPIYDFSSGVRVETGRAFSLARVAAERPVALIFGSYT